MWEKVNALLKPDYIKLCIEKHKDGTPHFHAQLKFNKKREYTDCHFADIDEYHGNYQTTRSEDAVDSYIMKNSQWRETGEKAFTSETNFMRKFADRHAYKRYRKQQELKDPYPFLLPNGYEVCEPKEHTKCCNFLIIGNPDWGKSTWLNDTFNGKKVLALDGDKRYPFDSYAEHRILIWDDIIPTEEQVIAASQLWKIEMSIGPTRYHAKFWEENVRRTLIIICNPGKEPPYHLSDRFKRRFITIDVDNMCHEELQHNAMLHARKRARFPLCRSAELHNGWGPQPPQGPTGPLASGISGSAAFGAS